MRVRRRFISLDSVEICYKAPKVLLAFNGFLAGSTKVLSLSQSIPSHNLRSKVERTVVNAYHTLDFDETVSG